MSQTQPQDSHKKKNPKKKAHQESTEKTKPKEVTTTNVNQDRPSTKSTQESEIPFWDPTVDEWERHSTHKDLGEESEKTDKEDEERKEGKKNIGDNASDREDFPPIREKGPAVVRMAKCDKAMMKALMKISAAAGGDDEIMNQLDVIMSEYTKLKAITLELSHENKYQEGRLKEMEEKTKIAKTFAEVTRINADDTLPQPPVEDRKQTSALIITSESLPTRKIESVLKRKIDPSKLGLTDASMRPGRDGVVVTTTSKGALEKLKEAIQGDRETQNLQFRNPKPRRIEMKVVGIDPDTDIEALTNRIVSQNHLGCSEEDIELRRHWDGKNGITAIIALNRKAISALGTRKSLNLNWNRCPLYDNIFIPRCTKCSSYGHLKNECRESSRCFNCGGEDHQGNDCEEASSCPACMEDGSPPEDAKHSMMSWRCPVYLATLEAEKTRLITLID
ncbi:uncharacterized protein [Dermacentor albipictus]|uniref:uncharacterized protein n=1 Tax=Dermacentor albipictus TaxID=60249 RepID=UPI0031FC004E